MQAEDHIQAARKRLEDLKTWHPATGVEKSPWRDEARIRVIEMALTHIVSALEIKTGLVEVKSPELTSQLLQGISDVVEEAMISNTSLDTLLTHVRIEYEGQQDEIQADAEEEEDEDE